MSDWLKDKTAVVPIDFGDQSEMAIDSALEILGDPGKITVLHVAPDLAVIEPGIMWGEISDESRETHLKEAFAKRFADPKYAGLKFDVRFGDAGHGIAKYAQTHDAGMVIMPSHGRTGFDHLLIGSVAERVIRYAHCPVLVLRK
ncbi:Universal stress protein [Pirellulimonas nuda]|uniref:Universal stress protein n=1 Tax=Pirellulimonas nuda TaxID=2528009 RepID=A0A518DFB7_9BACT|nr:universal stress protein [Pirellulimonas nuda]QDU90169.1 Universal stress protein [Pirellulimonas nuda]